MYTFSWGLIILQFILSIGLGIYPFTALPDAKKIEPLPFYSLVAMLTLLSGAQAFEKIIALRKNRGKLSGEEFVEKYTNGLIEAVKIISYLPADQQYVHSAQKQILNFISSFVKLYYEDKENLEISANLMLPHKVNDYTTKEDKFNEDVKFVDIMRSPSTYQCVLTLSISSASIQGLTKNFTLPVDSQKQRLLFGAPKAYVLDEITQVVDITNNIELNKVLEGQLPEVAKEIRGFLETMKYKSFASLPLRDSDKTIGVVNIQSNQTHVLGKSKDQVEQVEKYIAPLISILAILASPGAIKT